MIFDESEAVKQLKKLRDEKFNELLRTIDENFDFVKVMILSPLPQDIELTLSSDKKQLLLYNIFLRKLILDFYDEYMIRKASYVVVFNEKGGELYTYRGLTYIYSDDTNFLRNNMLERLYHDISNTKGIDWWSRIEIHQFFNYVCFPTGYYSYNMSIFNYKHLINFLYKKKWLNESLYEIYSLKKLYYENYPYNFIIGRGYRTLTNDEKEALSRIDVIELIDYLKTYFESYPAKLKERAEIDEKDLFCGRTFTEKVSSFIGEKLYREVLPFVKDKLNKINELSLEIKKIVESKKKDLRYKI